MQENTIKHSSDQSKSIPTLLNSLNEKSIWIMLFLGFSAGLPILLVFGTLGTWLNEAGVKKSTITYFSWAGLGYGFKFIWAPLIDQAKLPLLTHWLGRRRSWLLLCQVLLLFILAGMAMTDPIGNPYSLTVMALLAVALGFISASQDIVIDAYRIEVTPPQFLGLSSSSYILGYRLGMIVAGTFALIISEKLGSELNNYQYSAWQSTYLIMAAFMLIGIITTLIIREPAQQKAALDNQGSQQLILLFIALVIPFILVYAYWQPILESVIELPAKTSEPSPIKNFLYTVSRFSAALIVCFSVAYLLTKKQLISTRIAAQAYWNPIKEFIQRYPAKLIVLILLLIGFYRVSDMVLGVVANLFYQDIGFSKEQIGYISKIFGLTITILGGFVGGFLITRYGTMTMLMIGAVFAALTNLLFMGLADMSTFHTSNIAQLFNFSVNTLTHAQSATESINCGVPWQELCVETPNQITALTKHYGDTPLMLTALTLIICADNIAGGIANIAFLTFLSRLSNIEFTAMQYAIFSSLMTLLPRLIGGYSGSIVDASDYQTFFLITTLMGLPVILLVWLVAKRLTLNEDNG